MLGSQLTARIPRFLIKIDEPIALVRVGAEIVYSTYIFLQLIALYARRSDLYRLIDTLRECVENPYPDDVRAFILSTRDTINKSSVMYSKCFFAVCISYIIMPFMATSAVVVRNRRNQTGEREEYVMPTEMNFYYLDIRFSLLHYSLYFGAVSGLSVIGSLVLCTKDVLDFSLIRTASMLFQATAQQIRNLPPGASQAKLEAIIHSHRSTLKCAAQLQNALNSALLIQITFCTAIWCLMLFYILLLVLPLPLKLLALLGVNKNPSERFRLYAIYIYLWVAMFIPKLCLGYETIPQCFRSIAEGMFSFNTTVTFIMLPLKMNNLEGLLQNLKRFTQIGKQ
uniref:Uncharacterized protein n=1 Tax=Anopheles melas TaxID=34690 RepID=A0A182TRE4_9DIPT